MRRTARTVALLVLAMAAPSLTADPRDEWGALQGILHDAQRSFSEPEACADWVDPAIGHAQTLAQESCTTGFSYQGVHGVNLAIWDLMRVGSVVLHRHGCGAESRRALTEARKILVDTPVGCLAGKERDTAVDNMQETAELSAGIGEGVPALTPDLFSDPGPNHCSEENPPEGQIKTKAQNYLNNRALPEGHHADPNTGVVSCDASDPEGVWRATFTVIVTTAEGANYDEVAYVKFSDWKCSLDPNPSERCE